MAASVTHALTADGDPLVGASDWNDEHVVTGVALSSHTHSGADITSGTVADGQIDAAIARDSEVTSAISTHAGIATAHGTFANASHSHSAGDLPDLDSLTVPSADVSLNSHKITSLATPTADTDAATKKYADDIISAAAAIVVKEIDGSPSVSSGTLRVPNGTLTDDGGGQVTFNPVDLWLPWHISLIPMIWTPDATTGTWTITAFSTPTTGTPPFYLPGSATNSGSLDAFFNSGGAQNDAVAWDVILAAGTWDAHFWVRESTNTGIITLNQDGASQGTVDTYAAAAAWAKVSITGWTVSATGKHRMEIKAATKNASASNYFLEIIAIEFRRTA